MKNFEWCVYTYKHRKAFEYTVKQLIKKPELRAEMLKRARVHDMDKMLLYLFFDQKFCQKRHVTCQAHHLESGLAQTYYDTVETVIDYECAPLTKPDKPLNAYDLVMKLTEMNLLTQKKVDELLAIMHELGIDHSEDITVRPENAEFMKSLGEVTEEMILLEVMDYVRVCDSAELEFIRESETNERRDPD